VLDLVAQPAAVARWQELANAYNAGFHFVECICSDQEAQLVRTENRVRNIPGWYELTQSDVQRSRERYQPITISDKIVVDSMRDLQSNVEAVLLHMSLASGNDLGPVTSTD
jgi:hypothetical protein